MASGVGQVHVRKHHGKMEVQAFGQTPRGQKFIKASKALSVTTPADKKFKSELRTAVDELLGSDEPAPQ